MVLQNLDPCVVDRASTSRPPCALDPLREHLTTHKVAGGSSQVLTMKGCACKIKLDYIFAL